MKPEDIELLPVYMEVEKSPKDLLIDWCLDLIWKSAEMVGSQDHKQMPEEAEHLLAV